MKKLILFITAVFAFGLQIDVESILKRIQKDPNDIKDRLVISSYFIEKKDYKNALRYLDEVLKKDPKNTYAIKLKRKISALQTYDELLKNKNPNEVIKSLYEKAKYKELVKIYLSLKSLGQLDKLNEDSKLKTARVLMWEGYYDDSINLLSTLKNKNNLDYYEIAAYDLYYKGNYKQAQRYFTILYQTTGNIEYAKKLLDIYFYLGDYEKAKKLILTLKRTNPKIAKQYELKLEEMQKQAIEKLKNNYLKNPNFQNLKAYAIALYQTDPNKAIQTVKNYIKLHPQDNNAVVFLAQLLSWSGNNDEALKYLSTLNNNLQAKLLLGKILAWQGNYKKAIIYLSDVYSNGNQNQKYEAKKMLAFIYLWEGNKTKAKKLFEELYKQNPKDEDVKEQLMILNGNVKPLIKKYEKLLKKFPTREDYILKLADLYYMIKDYKNAAYYYERYLKIHPENLEIYKTLGDIYLELKDYYKGFGLWEYYANYKNTKEAYYELALRYFWNGFNKEALNVLDDLLKKYPNFEKAIILKAKILKINPRFVNSSSAATIDDYFNNKSEQLKILGDRAYFNELYKTAIDYYKDYLFLQPNDYDVREKYAYALENAKEFAKAAGEFFLLMWYKKDPVIEYHYAYNLQKAGKIQKAKKIYEKLLNEVPKPVPAFIKKFLDDWKKAWESMNIKEYSKFYSPKIKNNLYWRLRKQSIFKKAGFISVGIYDPVLIYRKGDIYKVRFFQVYASQIKKDKGYKTLTLECKNQQCEILKEEWKPGKYIPYNPNNSLEKYIRENLNEINKSNAEKIKIIELNSNKLNQKTEKTYRSPSVLPKKIQKTVKETNLSFINNDKPVIAPGLKMEPLSEKEALDLTYLNSVRLNKKNTLSREIKEIENKPLYNWKIEGDVDYFVDNQQTLMWTRNVKISKHVHKRIYAFVFYKNYYLNQAKANKKGFLYGAGIEKRPFLFDFFIDRSGKNTIGWDFSYYPFLLPGMTLNINKHNMVYSRRSICSAKHTKIKFELTRYLAVTPYRDLWWSVAYEKVDDSNNVLTPQFEYDFYNTFIKKDPVAFYISGWYQFNSKQTSCYYSPEKTDTNIIGIKHKHSFNPFLSSFLKGGVGYSFWDKSYVYNISGYLTYAKNNFYAKTGCILSNTFPTNGNIQNYRSIECILKARIQW